MDKVCNLTSQTDCNKVLESKEIKLPFGVDLGDVAVVYFTSTTIFWMLSTFIDYNISVLLYLSVLSVPVTLVSLYYQQFVIKAWCTLCLVLVGVLWLQFGLFMFNEPGMLNEAPELISIVSILFILVQTLLLWSIGKKYILKQKELEIDRIKFSKFKSNIKLFQLALASSPPIPSFSSIDNANEIRIGNTDAKTQVTMITNPTCGFCKDAYEILKQGIDRFPENYGLTIRFSVDTKNTQSLGYRVALRLVMIYQVSSNLDIKSTLNILSKDKTALEKWLKDDNFSADSNLNVLSAKKLLIEEKEWCVNNGVFFTPFILINNIPFPEQYDISDLPLVLSDLVDYYDGELQIAV